jgi:hypothetical protein
VSPYAGDIWGSLPGDYPTTLAQRSYRHLLAVIPESRARELMGYGFKGAAYRFRAAIEYHSAFQEDISTQGGAAPSADREFSQNRSLFGFLVSGLASLESLTFAMHSVSSHYSRTQFRLDIDALRNVNPFSVAEALGEAWPDAPITRALERLIQDAAYAEWRDIRNVLAHRAVPPRLIMIRPGESTSSLWLLTKAGSRVADEPLETATDAPRIWLTQQVTLLWEGIEASFPPTAQASRSSK